MVSSFQKIFLRDIESELEGKVWIGGAWLDLSRKTRDTSIPLVQTDEGTFVSTGRCRNDRRSRSFSVEATYF